MNRIINLVVMILLFTTSFSQDLKTPSQGKSIVYFTRYDATGFLINFKYFDGEKYLGKFNYGKYLIYECDPGKHIFWSKAENMDFIDANLEADKIYIIDSSPQMGAIKAGVKLIPFSNQLDNYDRYKKRIFKSLEKGVEFKANEQDLKEDADELKDLIKKGLEKFKVLKLDEDSSKIEYLFPYMFYDKNYFKEKDLTNKK